MESPLWVQCTFWKGVCLGRADQGKEEKMELPPSLVLGTIDIWPLHGMIDLTTRVWIRSLGMAMGRC